MDGFYNELLGNKTFVCTHSFAFVFLYKYICQYLVNGAIVIK